MNTIVTFLFSVWKKITPYIKYFSGFSMFTFGILPIVYVFGETMPRDICADVIYTSLFPICTDRIMSYVHILEYIFGSLTLVFSLGAIFSDAIIQKRFFRFLKWYFLVAIVIAVIGSQSQFCLMWSCSSMFGAALAIDGLIFIAFYFSIIWSVLAKKAFGIILCVPIILFLLVYGISSFVDYSSKYPDEVSQTSRHDNGDSCFKFKNLRERDQCLFLNAFRCDDITSLDIKANCVAIVQRNSAVNTNNLEGCDKIVGGQRRVCRSLILERRINTPTKTLSSPQIPQVTIDKSLDAQHVARVDTMSGVSSGEWVIDIPLRSQEKNLSIASENWMESPSVYDRQLAALDSLIKSRSLEREEYWSKTIASEARRSEEKMTISADLASTTLARKIVGFQQKLIQSLLDDQGQVIWGSLGKHATNEQLAQLQPLWSSLVDVANDCIFFLDKKITLENQLLQAIEEKDKNLIMNIEVDIQTINLVYSWHQNGYNELNSKELSLKEKFGLPQ